MLKGAGGGVYGAVVTVWGVVGRSASASLFASRVWGVKHLSVETMMLSKGGGTRSLLKSNREASRFEQPPFV